MYTLWFYMNNIHKIRIYMNNIYYIILWKINVLLAWFYITRVITETKFNQKNNGLLLFMRVSLVSRRSFLLVNRSLSTSLSTSSIFSSLAVNRSIFACLICSQRCRPVTETSAVSPSCSSRALPIHGLNTARPMYCPLWCLRPSWWSPLWATENDVTHKDSKRRWRIIMLIDLS